MTQARVKLKKHRPGFKVGNLDVSKNSAQVPGCVGERVGEDACDVGGSLHCKCRHHPGVGGARGGFRGRRHLLASGSSISCAICKQESEAGRRGETFIVKRAFGVSEGRVIGRVAHI